jgi:hypothetical protein
MKSPAISESKHSPTIIGKVALGGHPGGHTAKCDRGHE